MKILLIRPPRIKQAISIGELMFSEPIGLEMIYEVLHEQHEIEIFDMLADKLPLRVKLSEFEPEVVGVTSLCIDVLKVLRICSEIKLYNKNIITMVGGTHTYLAPEDFYNDAVDHVFEYTTRDNLNAFVNMLSSRVYDTMIDGIRSRKNDYLSTGVNGVNEYILPNRQSTEKYRQNYSYYGYRPSAIMGIGRGCEKACMFCLRWRIEGYKEELYPDEITVEDLKNIKEETIMIFDNDIACSKEKLNYINNKIEELNIKKNFICYASVEGIIKYQEELKRFKKNGLKVLLVGYETFSDEEMKFYTKNTKAKENYMAATFLKENGIDVWASFMAHPDWTVNDFKMFRKYVKSLDPEVATVSPLTPFRKLPLNKLYKDRFIYEDTDFEKWSFGQVIIKPMNMSLRRYYFELLKTSFYLNFKVNDFRRNIRAYGYSSVLRLLAGSIKMGQKYVQLMLKS